MIDLAFIGRNSPGKGCEFIFEALSHVNRNDIRIHFFTDYLDNNLVESLNVEIIRHGWISSENVWRVNFDFVLIPMNAPETFSFILHESVKNNKGVIVNGCNESLTSQIIKGGLFFSSTTNFAHIINNLCEDDFEKAKCKLYSSKTLWERLS